MDVPKNISDYNRSIDYVYDGCQESLLPYEVFPKFTLAQIVLFSLELLFSTIGLVLNIAFICRKKTHFLVRLFVYLSVTTTLLVGLAIGLVMRSSIHRPDSCEHSSGIYNQQGFGYAIWISSVLSFTAYSILLWKLCAQMCSCCMRRQPCCVNRTPKQQVILEVVFLLIIIVLPIPFFIVSGGEVAIYMVTPAAMLLGLIGYVILLVWFCVQRKLIAKRRCVKELVMWFMYFIVTILSIAYFVLSMVELSEDTSIGLIILLVTISALYPYCVLGYLLYSFRTKRVQHADNRIQVDETNLVNAHPLTWFSQTTTDAAV